MVRFKRRHRPVRFITNRLRVLRAGRRWTQDDLAKRMGFQSKFRIWELENETGAEPSVEEKRQLARIFGCRQGQIFPSLPRVIAS